MTRDLRAAADTRLDQALADARVADPRPPLREVLRELRERSADGFERARRYYEDVVLPLVADDAGDALAGWIDYGRFVAELDGPGRVVAVHPDGRALPLAGGYETGTLVLFLPEEQRRRAMALAVPLEPTPHQRASLDLLT